MTQNNFRGEIMKLIGLIGGSGVGKSVVCDAAKSLGFAVIDADIIGHNIILMGKPAYNEIVSFFGRDILLENGEIDRKKLGMIVFSDKDKLCKLNEITHNRIDKAIADEIALCNNSVVVIDGAVLYKAPIFQKCDKIIAVTMPKESRIQNICNRDGITYNEAQLRVNSQISDEDYSNMANITIQNDKGLADMFEKSVRVLKEVSG